MQVADAAVGRGAHLITHLFNAMSGSSFVHKLLLPMYISSTVLAAAFHHRDPGVVGLLGRMYGGVKPSGKGVASSVTGTAASSVPVSPLKGDLFSTPWCLSICPS